jgi:hypothetical protein
MEAMPEALSMHCQIGIANKHLRSDRESGDSDVMVLR